MRTDWNQAAREHTPLCDDLDSLMDMVGELQRKHAFGTDGFVSLGLVRMAICDAQAVAETECKWKGGSYLSQIVTRKRCTTIIGPAPEREGEVRNGR